MRSSKLMDGVVCDGKDPKKYAAAAQRKAIEIAEDVARQADPSIAPLFEKMRKAGEPRRPQGDNRRDRKQPE